MMPRPRVNGRGQTGQMRKRGFAQNAKKIDIGLFAVKFAIGRGAIEDKGLKVIACCAGQMDDEFIELLL